MVTVITPSETLPLIDPSLDADPWVADLDSSFGSHECQSTVGFDNHPCWGVPHYYVELSVHNYGLANPRWEGKLCSACLAGWIEWATEEPDCVEIVSINPIVIDS